MISSFYYDFRKGKHLHVPSKINEAIVDIMNSKHLYMGEDGKSSWHLDTANKCS